MHPCAQARGSREGGGVSPSHFCTVNVSEVFPYDETAQLTGGYIAEWLRKFRRNELTPRLKSAPVPTKRRDEHHIHVLVVLLRRCLLLGLGGAAECSGVRPIAVLTNPLHSPPH